MNNQQEVKFEGIERMFTISKTNRCKIAHISHIAGPSQTFINGAPKAFQTLMNTHPRMRVKQSKQNPFVGLVNDPVSIEEATKLVRVETNVTDWKVFVHNECNIPIDCMNDFPFYISILVESEDQFKVIVFSDHYMSDGYSGLIVLNGMLKHVANSSTTQLPTEPLPLRPSTFSLQMNKGFKKKCDAMLLSIVKPLVLNDSAKFKPSLPTSDKASTCFATGDPDRFKETYKRCKEEGVTINGAFVICVMMALAVAKYKGAVTEQSIYKCTMDVDYNMRKQYKVPFEEDSIGFHVGLKPMEYFAETGIRSQDKFWDLARKANVDTKQFGTSIARRLSLLYTHKYLNSKKFKDPDMDFHTNDLNVSNLGRYPYQLSHTIGDTNKTFSIRSLHLYNHAPKIGPLSCIFLSTVDAFAYSFGHRFEPESGQLFFNKIVEITESIGSFQSEVTIRELLSRFASS